VTTNTVKSTAQRTAWPAMNTLLFVAGLLVFIAGFQLYVMTEHTNEFFAWTIAPPKNLFLTAAFLGASYWASCVLELVAARQRSWTHARIAVPAVLLFTSLTFIVTLRHLNLFHLGPPLGQPASPVTIALTYVWLIIYAAVPLLMGYLLFLQLQKKAVEAPRAFPAPTALRVALGIQSAVMMLFGLILLFAPQLAPAVWPWKLTPLTSQVIGAWLVSLPIAGFQAVWENDLHRTRAATVSYIALGVFHLVAVARYPGDLDWTRPGAWLYLLFLASTLTVGGLYELRTRKGPR
jgi:hypothetical protein